MAKFAYNNAKHASIEYTPFELNCGYHPRVFYKENIHFHFRSKATDELTKKLRNLMVLYNENLKYAQELQKRAYNKETKLRSYAPGKKI